MFLLVRYGFKNVVIPADILHSNPDIWPFDPLMEQVYKDTARPLPKPVWDGKMKLEDALKIDAIFVFNDPRDWALDSQIIMDLMMSEGGVVGSLSHKNGADGAPNGGWQQHEQPPLYFSNPDVFWATTYHQPRLGQGAFQAALAGIWHKITNGQTLQSKTIGKPFRETYEYAERVLNSHRQEVLVRGGHGVKRSRSSAMSIWSETIPRAIYAAPTNTKAPWEPTGSLFLSEPVFGDLPGENDGPRSV
ncbi:unnamed protein product [Parascedosporium putredinis]|uniref:Uncharacterized protein n=1 Tax=Parascedosporium putredinis TaxID=1442378 RepID=A0A9P1GWH3_9PEZI|nr:unnamed protein product [Parascedosporium putredinis]CAI7988259.1 unnamed protein product [Parascedosporium putredinis]